MSLIAKMWMLVHPKLPIGCFSLPGAGGCWWLFGFSSGADSPFYLTGWNPFRGCVLCLHLGDVRAGLPSWSAQSCSSSPFHPSVTDSQPEWSRSVLRRGARRMDQGGPGRAKRQRALDAPVMASAHGLLRGLGHEPAGRLEIPCVQSPFILLDALSATLLTYRDFIRSSSLCIPRRPSRSFGSPSSLWPLHWCVHIAFCGLALTIRLFVSSPKHPEPRKCGLLKICP